MKALILAAGFGTRLRPITNHYPKPLCTVFGIELLDLACEKIKAAGIKSIAINTHYLSEKILEHIDRTGLNIELISHEDQIRGTGGSIYPLKDWLSGEDLLIYNGDIISTIDLKNMMQEHRSSNALATMALLPVKKPGKNPVMVRNDQVLGFGNRPRQQLTNCQPHTFTGIHIISSAMIAQVPETMPWDIIDSYQLAIDQQQIVRSFIHTKFWADLGSPASYWQAHLHLMNDQMKLYKQLTIDKIRLQKSLTNMKWDKASRCAFPSDWSPTQHQCIYNSVITQGISSDTSFSLKNCLVLPEVRHINGTYHNAILGWDDYSDTIYEVPLDIPSSDVRPTTTEYTQG